MRALFGRAAPVLQKALSKTRIRSQSGKAFEDRGNVLQGRLTAYSTLRARWPACSRLPCPRWRNSRPRRKSVPSAARAVVTIRPNCAGVPTGGQAALQCLQQHAGSVSPGCRNALKPLSEKPTQAQAAPEQPAATAAAPSPQLTLEGASLAAQEAATLHGRTRSPVTAGASPSTSRRPRSGLTTRP